MEVEVLAFAVAIDTEYDLFRESKKTIIICADNKPVAEAVELIKKGKWSSSLRINWLIAKVNKISITVKHVSGKFKLNPVDRECQELEAELWKLALDRGKIAQTTLTRAVLAVNSKGFAYTERLMDFFRVKTMLRKKF